MVSRRSVSYEYKKAALIRQLDILEILDLDTYSNKSPEVQQFYQQAHEHADDVQLFLGKSVSASKSPVRLLNEVLKDLGFATKQVSMLGCRGDRVRVYEIKNADCPVRTEILNALNRKAFGHGWESVIARSRDQNINTSSRDHDPPSVVVGGVFRRVCDRELVRIIKKEGEKYWVAFLNTSVRLLNALVSPSELVMG